MGTPELTGDGAIEEDPLPPGQVWGIGPGTGETSAALYRIEAATGPGSGARILNQPVPPAFRESVRVGKQNLYANGKRLVGDREPRGHEYRFARSGVRPMFRAYRTIPGSGFAIAITTTSPGRSH